MCTMFAGSYIVYFKLSLSRAKRSECESVPENALLHLSATEVELWPPSHLAADAALPGHFCVIGQHHFLNVSD